MTAAEHEQRQPQPTDVLCFERIGDNQGRVIYDCPACGHGHMIHVMGARNNNSATWTWNGSYDKPTFSPSVNANHSLPHLRCHTWVREGKVDVCGDSAKRPGEKAIPMTPWND